MPSEERRPASPTPLSPRKKARFTIEEGIAEMQCHLDKIRADELEVDNVETSRLLQLPQEILEEIYNHVYGDQVFRLCLSANSKALISRLTYRHPFALRSTCRKLRQDSGNYPYTKTTFRMFTFRFVSMFDSWQVAIRQNPNVLLDFLESVPAPWIKHIEVIGVQRFSKGSYRFNMSKLHGYEEGIDYKVEMEETIRMVYPRANITFRNVGLVDQM
ncbi:hypothetical protein N0V86_002167 [Didymella sp. IMI 355093]|nr:hypothetical protein N0V86_002167 [Didymella sp. IMI 355093]